MTEPKHVTNILDFAAKTEEYTISNPESGEDFVIRLKQLKPVELAELSSAFRRPQPPVKDFTKDSNGNVKPVLDEDNPAYLKALAEYNANYVFSWLIASWDGEIPGETLEDKMKTLRDNIPNWVFLALQTKLQEVQGYKLSEVAYQKKISKTRQIEFSNTKSAKNAADG